MVQPRLLKSRRRVWLRRRRHRLSPWRRWRYQGSGRCCACGRRREGGHRMWRSGPSQRGWHATGGDLNQAPLAASSHWRQGIEPGMRASTEGKTPQLRVAGSESCNEKQRAWQTMTQPVAEATLSRAASCTATSILGTSLRIFCSTRGIGKIGHGTTFTEYER